MQRWNGLADVPTDWPRSVVTIGVFDGVHRGHRFIIDEVVRRAHQIGAPAVVVTFDPHPSAVVRPGTEPTMLATLEHRIELLAGAGADAVCVLEFTPQFSQLTPEQFASEVLVGRIHALDVVVGENFRFGHRAAGDVATLAAIGVELGGDRGFDVEALALSTTHEGVWSSTFVRGLVAAGDVANAAKALARPHRVEGRVVVGDQRGRDLGFPTANLEPRRHSALPADGVYAGWLSSEPYTERTLRYPAAISVGTNPTFDGVSRRVEAYVLDRDDLQLYGQHVAVDFVERIRPMVKFESIEELAAQMSRDVEAARRLTAVTST